MNPFSTPYPHHPPFPYPLQNPNPSPGLYFHSLPNPPTPPPPPPQIHPFPPPPTTTTTTTTPPILDLSTTLSSLTHLLSLSDQTLNSLPSILSTQTTRTKPKNFNHVPCPNNPHHIMPPESLFLHSLHCPSPLPLQPTSLFDSLHYPKTLHLQNLPKNLFSPSIQDANTSELCFSLDGYYDEFGSNFFYKDCPGVVNFNGLDNTKRSFTLPGFLSMECADLFGSSEGEVKSFDENGFRVLPSDLWAIRREIEGWVDYPSIYSYSVFCAILGLNVIKKSDLRSWIIANSPRYGVVIDVHMRDHISVLFRLCVKAIRNEALGLVSCEMNKKTSSFKCPVLVQLLMWIVSQLSVLYGEVNAKCFAIHIFKQCVINSANNILLFPSDSNLKERSRDLDANRSGVRDVKLEELLEGSTECEVGKGVNESVDGEVIFVSQVAAAVAALHERSLLEAKIKGLRISQPIPRYQRVVEHTYMSNRADEEREKRPTYRAIIEHDSLFRKQSSNQETRKTKTREELLAEERDYKRRRMSYRGKKLNRTTLQVMRDIIDEQMEEIRQAGGIGCLEKGPEEEGMSLKPTTAPDATVDVDELRKSNSDVLDAIRTTPNHYWRQSHPDHGDATPQDYEQKGQGHHGRREHLEYQRSTSRDIHGRENYTGSHGREHYIGSSESRRSHSRSCERNSDRREPDDLELAKSKDHKKRSSRKSNDHGYKTSYSMPDSANNFSVQKDDQKLDVGYRRLRNSYGNQNSNSQSQNGFEDRYDPKEFHDVHEDGVYDGSKYARPEAFRV